MKHEYMDIHLAKHEYIEGPEATENFKRVARAVFRPKRQLYGQRRSQRRRLRVGSPARTRLRKVPLAPSLPTARGARRQHSAIAASGTRFEPEP